jgi:DHA1 family bicyclomycin/chloramphenicol resistance-like MFS transporter
VRLKIANARGVPTIGITLLLASLSMISPLSIDTFLPSLPTIAAHFGITRFQVQQIITAYLLPFAFFSLVHGPVSDALGRRRVVLAGLVLYTFGSIGCFLAPSFATLLICRVLQGTAAGIGPTVSRAVVRDMFEGPGAQRLMSSIMLVFSLAPAVAPVIGGWVHVTLGWRWVFGMLVVLGAGLLITCALLLPETHPPAKRTQFHPLIQARSCVHVAAQPSFLLLALSAALAMSSLFVYIGSAPAIILERWHLTETQFHYLFIPVVGGFMIASLTSGRFAGRVSRVAQIRTGFALLCLAGVTGATGHLLRSTWPMLFDQSLLFLMAVGAQLTYPVLTLEMIDMHPQARGAAASVQTFIALGVGGLAMGLLAPVLRGDLNLLSRFSLVTAVAAWLGWRAGTTFRRKSIPTNGQATV